MTTKPTHLAAVLKLGSVQFTVTRHREGQRIVFEGGRELTFARKMFKRRFEALSWMAQRYSAIINEDGTGHVNMRRALHNSWGNCLSDLIFLAK